MNDVSNYEVVHQVNDKRFEIDLGEEKAILIYMIRVGLLILLHTEVPLSFRRRGITGRLATATLEYAKNEGLKVRSYCSYTTRFIKKPPEWQDLLG